MDREEGARLCVQSLGIKPGGPNPGGPALGKPRSCFNVNFNSYARGSRSGTKVPLALLICGLNAPIFFCVLVPYFNCGNL